MRKSLRITVALLALMGIFLFQVPNAFAQETTVSSTSGYENIASFKSRIRVHKDGSVDINEKIRYDFGYASRHGIFRYIPYEYEWQGQKPKGSVRGSKFVRVTPIAITKITRDGNSSEEYETSVENGNKVIKIGSAGETISGQHDYEISYSINNFINSFKELDELNININGSGWDVSFENLSVTIEIDGVNEGDELKTLCFTGPLGSSNRCQSPIKSDSNILTLQQDNLYPNENVTVIVGIPKGVLSPESPLLKEKWTFASAFRVTPVTVTGFFVLLLLGLGAVGCLVAKKGRDRRYVGNAVDAAMGNITGKDEPKPIFDLDANPVEFIPPDNIRPGLIGVLVDEKVDNVDIAATIIDLAVRGYIYIGESSSEYKTLFGGTTTDSQYWVSKLKEYRNDSTLNDYERQILNAFFSKKEKFFISQITAKQGTAILKAHDQLYDEVVKNKWYAIRPDKTRHLWLRISVGALVFSIALLFLVANLTPFAFSAMALPIAAIIFVALYKRMPARTAKGTAMVGRVAGFRKLFDVGEGQRQAFAEKANLFLEYLPFAIVFGCADKWAKVFEDLGLSEEQLGINRFYLGDAGFSATHFAYSMGAFSSLTLGSIASAQAAAAKSFSSGSSGFSGGGFSGGGGGGGGGGSW